MRPNTCAERHSLSGDVYLNGVCRIHGHLVVRSVAMRQPEVVVLSLQVQVGEDELHSIQIASVARSSSLASCPSYHHQPENLWRENVFTFSLISFQMTRVISSPSKSTCRWLNLSGKALHVVISFYVLDTHACQLVTTAAASQNANRTLADETHDRVCDFNLAASGEAPNSKICRTQISF